jgi:hypothetical protein
MGQLTFQASLGGSVNLIGPNTASTLNLTLPSADGSSGQVLTTNGSGTLAFSGVSLTTGVSGTLPIANGGTNSTATATAGGIGYGTGTAHAYTSAGTTGQVLTSAGSGTPTWSTPSAGAMIFLSSVTGSNFSVLSLDYAMTLTYDMYVVVGTNFAFNDYYSEIPYMRMKLNGAYATSGYTGMDSTTTDRAALFNGAPSATSPSWSFDFVWWIPTPSNTNYKFRTIYSQYMVSGTGGGSQYFQGGLTNSAAAGSNALTGVQILRTNYNYQTGTMALYGISKS